MWEAEPRAEPPVHGEREAAMRERADYLRTIIIALAEAGGAPEIVTGGGTGTHRIDVGLGIFTELQVGSYIFMDDEYRACDLTGEEGAAMARVSAGTAAGPSRASARWASSRTACAGWLKAWTRASASVPIGAGLGSTRSLPTYVSL